MTAVEGGQREVRRTQINLTYRFLHGEKLECADDVLIDRYGEYLQESPEAAAAFFFLRARGEEPVAETDEETIVIDVARAWCRAAHGDVARDQAVAALK